MALKVHVSKYLLVEKESNGKQAISVRRPSIRCFSIASQVVASSYLGNDELALALKVASGWCAVDSSPVTCQRRYKEALDSDHSRSDVPLSTR